ncbi:MAG: radical SAM protein [Bacillota bacterium]
MKVNEIFLSIQGESLSSGFPTIFVRFAGCNLRCSYCDTAYAYESGKEMTPFSVFEEIKKLHYKRICLTGGEPLLQRDLGELLGLVDDYIVTIETNGSVDIGSVELNSRRHSFVMDIKTPSSGCSDLMVFKNLDLLDEKDEIKFVIGCRTDYEWARNIVKKLCKKGSITFSPVFGKIDYAEVVRWILEDKLDIRFQVQLHKIIWGPEKTGV